jgi:hypothetical protein
MALQQHVDKLKDRPKDERQVVAISGAGAVVLILIVVWGFYFLKSLRQQQTLSGAAYDVPNDVGHQQVTQTYQTYDNMPQKDQFGLPGQQ